LSSRDHLEITLGVRDGESAPDIHGECRRRIAALEAIVAMQQNLVEEQQRKIEAFEARLNQNSRNSSRPPSSDPPSVPPRPLKPLSGRKPGGQPGHPGHKRDLLPPDQVNRVTDVKPDRCDKCGRVLRGRDPDPWRHQVTELPPIMAQTDEWRLHALDCPCGHVAQATLPEGVPQGAFGPRLQATLGYLTGVARLTKRPIEEVVKDLFGVSVSLGAIVAQQQAVSEAVAPAVEDARDYVQKQSVVNADETGWKEGLKGVGERGRKKAWLWVAVTQWVTVFLIHASRGGVAAKALLGEFAGRLGSDRWGGYNAWEIKKRQICWAHLIRDFVGFTERGGQAEQIGKLLLLQTEKMFELWKRVRDGTLARSTFQEYMRPIRRRVEDLLQKGTRCGEPKTQGMCKKILTVTAALWTFVRVEGVEPTNNAAERAIRHAVLYRKGCFGTQSEAGSRFVERILTVVATLRQQERNVMEYLTEACARAMVGKKPPSLLPSRACEAAA
jgi:transposase